MSLTEIQEVPKESLIMLSGPPGAGKSTFCHHVVLNSLAMEKPVVYVTTEHGPAEVLGLLREKGLGELPPGALSFIDAFGQTVGVTTTDRPDTISATCEDLNSINMAIAKLQERIGKQDILLSFDSLTSPYLFNKEEIIRFMRLCLAKFASQGNAVLTLMDEGCGKEEDLGAMMSITDGIMKMEVKESSRVINVVKHPRVEPARIEVPTEPTRPTIKSTTEWNPYMLKRFFQSFRENKVLLRNETGNFVNLFWANLAHWSGMLWDPKGFPTMIYDLNKEEGSAVKDIMPFSPLSMRIGYKILIKLQALGLFVPKKCSTVKDMKKAIKMGPFGNVSKERSGILEYLEDVSKTDEHYFRVYENSDCCGFENIGTTLASHIPPMLVGLCIGIEKDEREWNAIETKCIGLGDPYCEFKFVPGEIDGLKASLEKDISVVERIHTRLIENLMEFLLHEKTPVNRPQLGSDVHIHVVMHGMGFPHLAGDRYTMAQRMGGAMSGKAVGERLMKAGIKGDEAINRVVDFMNYCKVGKVTVGETIRIKENCESMRTKMFTRIKEPSCYFTTGFLNGLFSAIKNKHVRESRCIVAGDPYCEWEII